MDECTTEILNRFRKSWDETQLFYDNLLNSNPGWKKVEPIRQFISKLKQDKEYLNFRLGISIHILMISRSVNFGLRTDQKYIKIEAIDINDFEVTLKDADKIYRQYRISSLEDTRLLNLLKTLKDTLID